MARWSGWVSLCLDSFLGTCRTEQAPSNLDRFKTKARITEKEKKRRKNGTFCLDPYNSQNLKRKGGFEVADEQKKISTHPPQQAKPDLPFETG